MAEQKTKKKINRLPYLGGAAPDEHVILKRHSSFIMWLSAWSGDREEFPHGR